MNEKKKNESKKDLLLKKHLERQFRRFRPPGEVPGDLKKNVFDRLETLRLLSDIFELFTVKFTEVETNFFDQINGRENNDKAEGE
ncbi:MAG TPA: hypothetical protein ENJ20_05070 [Bacteroidetes bacterium]|nr:hypothetical protein [Bacteroidota bacterium]